MHAAKWFNILALLQVGFAQDLDVGYLKILQDGLINVGTMQQGGIPGANILSLIGPLLQQNQDLIINYASDTLTESLDEASRNYTSALCLNHTELFIKALFRRENWALRMIDAFGKPGPGLMDYSLKFVGNFDECIAIQADRYTDPAKKQGLDHPYTGKYCTGHVQLSKDSSGVTGPLEASIGMCLPDSCSDADGSTLMNIVALKLFKNMSLPTIYATCQEKSIEFTDKALAVSIVGAIFAAIIILATAYDVIIQHFLQKQPKLYEKDKCDLTYANGIQNNAFTITEEKISNGDSLKNGNVTKDFKDIEKTMPNAISFEKTSYKPGILGKLLLSFSVYTNAPKILNTSQPKGTLTCVNGIRFIGTTWVILGHTYRIGFTTAGNAATYFPALTKRFTFQAIMNATFSVDTFFVLSGLLVSYLSLKELKKRGGALKFNWLLFYFHRYWRLTPPYMLLLMLYVPTFKYWASGPLWPQKGIDVNECEDSWWTNMLYINNLYKSDQCMGWSWYLANDMQFYVISPLMLIPLFYSPIAGAVVCFALLLGTFICAGLVASHYDIAANMMFSKDVGVAMDKMYYKPWTRVGPYIVGFFLGYILYKTECKVKMSKLLNLVGWAIATAMAVSVLYGLYTPEGNLPDLSKGVSALYNATSRTAWGISVAWVIFACATGYGGPVNSLLSWRGIIPLSRLTYCAYLVHPIVMSLYFYSRKTMMYWYDLNLIYLFLGHLCISYAAAFVISLAFESPMMGLEKVLLGRKKNS
ncbi:O-acyltransferase like protein-like isoform X2 [Ruditapes philippinarum]|uniref:O-acyltransferase like protein-like isoform X2 n=1 Tax=Ruditapes philippinarum TaxID=129788 RepID=UPI00295C3A8C|nr:O-acyltransferase like protein-like isoform X2 [Ruditapes philippinarum]